MREEIEKIRQLMEGHNTVRDHLRLVGDEISDLEAMKDLQKLRDSYSGTGEVIVAEKLEELKRNIIYIGEGLRKHFEDEEKLLPGLLGEPLTHALLREHRQIKEEIANLEAISENKKLEEISQQRSPAIMTHISQSINTLRNTIEEHSRREDAVFQMLLAGLQED